MNKKKRFRKIIEDNNQMDISGCVLATVLSTIFFLLTPNVISSYVLGFCQGVIVMLLVLLWTVFTISYISSREVYWEEIK